jgi:hypothetical protein
MKPGYVVEAEKANRLAAFCALALLFAAVVLVVEAIMLPFGLGTFFAVLGALFCSTVAFLTVALVAKESRRFQWPK